MNAVLYVLRTGCQWRALPKDFPLRSTVYGYFWEWPHFRVLDRIHHALVAACRERDGREPSPSAAILDSQSVKAAEKGGARGTRSEEPALGRATTLSSMVFLPDPRWVRLSLGSSDGRPVGRGGVRTG